MPSPDESKRSLKLRLKIAAVSLLGFLIPSACSLRPTCYTPVVTPLPTDTPTPFVTCYTAPAPTATPITTFISPISPLPTPTPTTTPEARRLLRERLLADDRFPDNIARELES
ncbi:MAG: hypothetical protein DRI77_10000 [Chloroflexi bacterium]|nr:MAG: hypothetical protein DRI77_10000 [Chloroflexota bacterium]